MGGHFMTFTCPYFLPEVMVKFTWKARGHFVTLIEVGMHLIACISGHKWPTGSCSLCVSIIST